RRREEVDQLAIFAKPSLVLRASRNDHDVALAADPLFAAEAELHLALEHPHDLLIWVTVRLDMDASLDARPYDHPMVARENAAANLFADLLLRERGERTEAYQCRHNFLPKQDRLGGGQCRRYSGSA